MRYSVIERARLLGIPEVESREHVRKKCQKYIDATLQGDYKSSYSENVVDDLVDGPHFASLLAKGGEVGLEATGILEVIKTVSERLDGSSANKNIGFLEIIKTVNERLDGSSADKNIGILEVIKTVSERLDGSSANKNIGILEVIKTVSELLDGSSADKTIGAAVATCLFTSAITFMTAIVRSVVNLTNLDFPEVSGIRRALIPSMSKFLMVSLPEQWSTIAIVIMKSFCFIDQDLHMTIWDLSNCRLYNPSLVMAKFARFISHERVIDEDAMVMFMADLRPCRITINECLVEPHTKPAPRPLDFDYSPSTSNSVRLCDACGRHNHFYHTFQVYLGTREEKVSLKKCAGCEQRWYCSKECQNVHWEGHKAICKKLKKQKAEGMSKTGST
eukprot:gene6009-5300_t